MLVATTILLALLCSQPLPACAFGPFGGGDLDKGFNLLETASKVVPQGRIVQDSKRELEICMEANDGRTGPAR